MQAPGPGSIGVIPELEPATVPSHRPSSALVTTFLLLALALLPSPALSQAVRGRVVDDSTSVGVEGVRVTLQQFTRFVSSTITDSLGTFLIPLPGPGPYALQAERIGYATTRSRVFDSGATDTLSVEFRIHTEAILLDPLVVTAVSGRGRDHFERHQDLGLGVFITPEMVDSIGPRHPIDILQGQEKTLITWDWSARLNQAIPKIRTFIGSGCVAFMVDMRPVYAPRHYVNVRGPDGRPTATLAQSSLWESQLLEFLRGEDIVAAEYYRYIGEVPRELMDRAIVDEDLSGRGWVSANSMCGLLIFWTRAGW